MCGLSGSLPTPSHLPGHSNLIVFRAVARRTSMCCQLKKGMYHRPVRIFVQVTVGHFNGKLGNMRASGVETSKIFLVDQREQNLPKSVLHVMVASSRASFPWQCGMSAAVVVGDSSSNMQLCHSRRFEAVVLDTESAPDEESAGHCGTKSRAVCKALRCVTSKKKLKKSLIRLHGLAGRYLITRQPLQPQVPVMRYAPARD